MKKIFLVFSIVLLATQQNFAQSKIRMGLEGGPNYANFSAYGYDPKVAFAVGVTAEFQLKQNLYLTTDLLFERKRATNEISFYGQFDPNDPFISNGYVFKEYIQNDYLVLPVQLKYELSKYDPFYITAGVFLAYAINAEYFTDEIGNFQGTASNDFASIDYGLTLGFGKSFNIGNARRINVEVRENLGIANINDSDYLFSGSDVTTNSFNLLLGYSFDFK